MNEEDTENWNCESCLKSFISKKSLDKHHLVCLKNNRDNRDYNYLLSLLEYKERELNEYKTILYQKDLKIQELTDIIFLLKNPPPKYEEL